MEPLCTNPDCTNIVSKKAESDDIPRLLSKINNTAIDNVLAENIEIFHVHQYGSMVIFLEFLEGLDPSEELIEEYSHQGHVFLLPMKPYDLFNLRDGKIEQITYKASDIDRVWYKITIELKSKSVGKKLKRLFHSH
jgi:hypothetical protein